MNKEGFTLIELLAVILILGVISLIAVPTVNNIIKHAGESSFEVTVNNIIKEVENNCNKEKINDKNITTSYTLSNSGITPSLNIKRNLPTSGNIKVDNNCNTFVRVSNNKYIASKDSMSDTLDITEGNYITIIEKTSGTDYAIGSIYTINDGTNSSKWYVIGSDDDTVRLLSSLNIDVTKNLPTSTAPGTVYDLANARLTENNSLCTYPPGGCKVYAANGKTVTQDSTIKEYVDSYIKTLNLDSFITTSGLLKKIDLDNLGCDTTKLTCTASSYKWLYNKNFWTEYGVSTNADRVYTVHTSGNLYNNIVSTKGGYGVRPVITIKKIVIS